MGFPKRQKKCDYVFHIGNEMVDIVKDYTYLGTRISSPGNFTLSLEHLRQKALHNNKIIIKYLYSAYTFQC